MQQNLSESKLNKIARLNYNALVNYCTILSEEGYWDQPYSILKKSIHEMLDLYLQSCLIEAATFCNQQMTREQINLIVQLTDSNPLKISKEAGVSEDELNAAKGFLNNPPILLQLAGLRDRKNHTTMAGLFYDAILNILLVMAYLSFVAVSVVMQCLHNYCEKSSVFIRQMDNRSTIVDDKYLFRKICVQDLESSTNALMDAGDDFAAYKEMTMFYSEREEKLYVRKVQTDTEEHNTQKHDSSNHTSEHYNAENHDPANHNSEYFNAENHEHCDEEHYNSEIHNIDKHLAVRDMKNIESLSKEEAEAQEAITLAKQLKEKQEAKLNDLMNQLNELIGLNEVKQEMKSLINLIKVRKLREKYCLPEMDMSYHMVFTGNPGTGKTTVARLVAEIYKELGLLSKGTLVETDRAGLVAGYVGQTAIKVKEVVERAIGGVLFIDEAYSLSSQASANDFGMEAIDTLVKLMEDHREDLVIIVAGYKKEMQQFLESNTGLISRFNKFIEFPDYSTEELLEILESMAEHNGFTIEQNALELVHTYLTDMNQQVRDSFGNARGIRNMFERLVLEQANRVVTYENPTIEQLSSIRIEDVNRLL